MLKNIHFGDKISQIVVPRVRNSIIRLTLVYICIYEKKYVHVVHDVVHTWS